MVKLRSYVRCKRKLVTEVFPKVRWQLQNIAFPEHGLLGISVIVQQRGSNQPMLSIDKAFPLENVINCTVTIMCWYNTAHFYTTCPKLTAVLAMLTGPIIYPKLMFLCRFPMDQ